MNFCPECGEALKTTAAGGKFLLADPRIDNAINEAIRIFEDDLSGTSVTSPRAKLKGNIMAIVMASIPDGANAGCTQFGSGYRAAIRSMKDNWKPKP